MLCLLRCYHHKTLLGSILPNSLLSQVTHYNPLRKLLLHGWLLSAFFFYGIVRCCLIFAVFSIGFMQEKAVVLKK